MGEIIFMLIIVAVCIAMFFVTFSFPTSIIDKSGGPALFPRIVIAFLLVMVAIRIIHILRDPEQRSKQFFFRELFRGSRLIYLIMLAAYALSMPFLGYILSTCLFLNACIFYLYYKQEGVRPGKKRTAITTVISVAGTIGLYYCFTLMNVVLPVGKLWQ